MKAKNLAVMLDCSRNAVMTVDRVKEFILYLEKMGYNCLQLYTEDTYEIPEEPLFGHFRGRYSQAEIREIDAFASQHGIELQACIQTLAHLNQAFFWDKFSAINDTADILLCGDDRTYELIDNMFKSVASSYTSKTVNIGMDEAMLLGAGQYFDKNGYKKRYDILLAHLTKVSEIAKKYGLNLLMWSDMFFRIANNGRYYPRWGEKSKPLSPEVREKIPSNVALVYWDYYNDDQNFYEDMIERHLDLGPQAWFAGGAWKWLGFHSGNAVSIKRIETSTRACVKKGMQNIVLTMWGDNGNECPAFAVLPSLLYEAECLKGNYGKQNLKKKFREVIGENFDDFMLLDMLRPDGKEKGIGSACGAKELLYSDTFLGKFDSSLVGDEAIFFADMEKKFRRAKKRSAKFGYIFESYEKLCSLMKIKYDLGFRTRNAYKAKDTEQLKEVVSDYSRAIKKTEEFIVYFRKMWFTDNKPHGFDVQDIRLGGVIQRLKANKERLIEYIEGKVKNIPELDEELVPVFVGDKQKKVPVLNMYGKIVTPNALL